MSRINYHRSILLAGLMLTGFLVRAQDAEEKVDNTTPEVLLFTPSLFAPQPSEPLPAWITSVSFEGGTVGGATSAWHVADSEPTGTGKLWLDLDRKVMDGNLALSMAHERLSSSDMIIQLCDAQNRVVALDLFGNIISSALAARTDTFVIPLRKYPAATRIVLRRVAGDTTVYGIALVPVVLERESDTNLVEELQFARLLGDRLSPESELVRRVRAITGVMSAATNKTYTTTPVAPPPPNVSTNPVIEKTPVLEDAMTWKTGTPLPVACGLSSGVVLDGTIYVMGGYNGRWNSHVFTYNPKQPEKGWTRLGNMPIGRACSAAVTVNGKIYSLGGQDNHGPQADTYVYDPNTREWSAIAPLPVPLLRHSAVALNDKIYVMGGTSTKGEESAVYEFDTRQTQKGWTLVNNLPTTLNNFATTTANGKIYVMGGGRPITGASSTVYVFDPTAKDKRWETAGQLPEPRYVTGAATLNGKIYLVGGFNSSQRGINSVYMHDLSRPSEGWKTLSDLTAAKGESPILAVDGNIYAISGALSPCSYVPTVFVGSVPAR